MLRVEKRLGMFSSDPVFVGDVFDGSGLRKTLGLAISAHPTISQELSALVRGAAVAGTLMIATLVNKQAMPVSVISRNGLSRDFRAAGLEKPVESGAYEMPTNAAPGGLESNRRTASLGATPKGGRKKAS